MKIKIFLILSILFLITFNSCKKNIEDDEIKVKPVKGFSASVRQMPDEVNGFGSLSFLSKVDITSNQEAVITKLFYREGDFVEEGELIIQLENPQIVLAAERAQNNYSQALAACNLANSRLLEGIFQSEAQLLALEKSEAELDLIKRKWEENKRKHRNQETLYNAGGLHKEAFLVSRFTLDAEWDQILLMEKELEIRRIGSRRQDLERAGIPVPDDESERMNAYITLLTSGLRAELKAAEARLEAAEKELSSARIALSELAIYSPASGIVGARYLEEGERVKIQDKIITLIDTSSLYAIFPIRERDALRIEKEMAASVVIDGTGETRKGVVDLVYPQADSMSFSFLVRVLLENFPDDYPDNNHAESSIKPGMFTRVTITLGPPKEKIFIPETAIFNRNNAVSGGSAGNEGSIFIVNGTNLAERKVTLGESYGQDREILSGLYAGEVVVSRPSSDLKEGTYVTLAD